MVKRIQQLRSYPCNAGLNRRCGPWRGLEAVEFGTQK
jgi:hypothetical protein